MIPNGCRGLAPDSPRPSHGGLAAVAVAHAANHQRHHRGAGDGREQKAGAGGPPDHQHDGDDQHRDAAGDHHPAVPAVPTVFSAVRGRRSWPARHKVLPYTGRGYETLGVTKAAERGLAMNAADIVALAGSAAVLAGLGWFFFGPRKSRAAELAGGVQRIEVTVRGGYDPEVIRLRQGVPAELVFDRQESGDCTSRVVFPDLGVGAALPAFTRTAVRLAPARAGQFGFACGMNMIHGTLIVEPADNGEPAAAVTPQD